MVTGELSGDLHAASFLRALRELAPGVHVAGVGGPRLRAAGLDCLFPAEELAVVGLPGPRELRTILRVFRRLVRVLREERPHLLVLVDFPEFNLWLARFARRYGVPVFYYIAPQVWAWRTGRVKLIRRVVDEMAVILPFEEDFFRAHGVRARFVGHPLLDVVRPHLDRHTFCRLVGLDPERPLLGLFPGSRRHEVRSLFPLFRAAYQELRRKHPGLQGLVVQAPGLPEGLYRPLAPDLRAIQGYQYEVMNQAEAVLLASGTVTLEAAIVGVPMVVAYRVSPLTYFLGRRLVKVPFVSLVNLIAGRELVRELLQKEASVENLVRATGDLLGDQDRSASLRRELQRLRKALGRPGVAWRVAELALNLLRRNR